jgi:hypothetical protein
MGFAMLSERIVRLEPNRPALGPSQPLDLVALAPDVMARVMLAKAQGTFPRGLCDADLEAFVALTEEQGAI